MLLIYTDHLHPLPQAIVDGMEQIEEFIEVNLLTRFFVFDNFDCVLDSDNMTSNFTPSSWRERSQHDFDPREREYAMKDEDFSVIDPIERVFWG